jgi:predicted DNA-binding protein YlxM (UPF0122 family)
MDNQSNNYGDEAYKDESVLRELYLGQDNTLQEVSDILNTPCGTVYKYYKRYGLEKDAEYRFKRKYEVNEDTGCWEWTAATDKDGYGVHSDNDGDYIRAHRFAYQEYKDGIPNDAFILHECDNPSCANPDHLYAGTHEDNMQDAKERTDTFSTEKQREKKRKLTKEQVIEIRERYQSEDVSMLDLADIYGLHNSSIHELLHGGTWSDVPGPTLD